MDGPPPPIDDEQRNIIDKLAVFVVKNGLEFEEMTRQKQANNPRFVFLFGGEYSQYYQYRLACESAAAAAAGAAGGGSQMPPEADMVQTYEAQIEAMRKQLADSERNLKAQYDTLILQQQAQVDAAVEKLENEKISNLTTSVGLNIDTFSTVLDQLIQNCTKENISNCKHWIMENCKTDRLREVLLMYMLHRVKEKKATDQGRLHILYLMNDWGHNCMRKKMDAITQMLSRYVPQLYAIAVHTVVDPGCRDKLEKLMALWEGQKYFDDNAYKQLRNPAQTYANSQTAKVGEYQKVSAEIAQKVQTTYQQYKQQHQEYEKHVEQQISALQFSIRQAQQSKRRSRFDQTLPPPAMPQQQPPPQQQQQQQPGGPLPPRMPPPMPLMSLSTRPPPRMALLGNQFPDYPPTHEYDYEGPPTSAGPPMMWHGPPPMGGRPPLRPPFVPPGGPPPGFGGQRGPPPGGWGPRGSWGGPPAQSHGAAAGGYPTPPIIDESKLVPTVEYYDLPAGLMVPLVSIEDSDYLPLNPKDLRLPPPIPPNERLIMAMEAFYSTPTHDNPRDPDGWEKLALYEFYKTKGQAKQEASQRVKTEQRSPERRRSDSRSPSPQEHRERRRRSRSRSVSRSPSPDFASKQGGFQPMTMRSGPIGHDNRGHQLMQKMGWQGGGLGAEEQGREEPIDGGEVRDKSDQYKGLGSQEDGLFDQFRKQKSGAFQARFQRK